MNGVRAIAPLLGHRKAAGPNRRRSGRMRIDGLKCDRGRLVDLSAHGARLLSRRSWPVGEKRPVILTSAHQRMVVWAHCVWRRRMGPLLGLTGIVFEKLTLEQTAVLSNLARAFALERRPGSDE